MLILVRYGFYMISYMHIADMRRLERPSAILLQRDLAENLLSKERRSIYAMSLFAEIYSQSTFFAR